MSDWTIPPGVQQPKKTDPNPNAVQDLNVSKFPKWSFFGKNQIDLSSETPELNPKFLHADSYSVGREMGMYYREHPSPALYTTLFNISQTNHVVSAIHQAIRLAFDHFLQPVRSKYETGFKIRHKKLAEKDYTEENWDRVSDLTDWLLHTGQDRHPKRDSFRTLMKKWLNDRLRYDQVNGEITHRRDGVPFSLTYVPAYTCRLAPDVYVDGRMPNRDDLLVYPQYVQIDNGQVVREWYENQFIWGCSHPVVESSGRGYGAPELLHIVETATDHLWAVTWNRNNFTQGSSQKGVFNIQGNVPQEKLLDLRRQWMLQASGFSNAHRVIWLNADGLEWVPTDIANNEMAFATWINYLIQVACSHYGIDPSVVGFDPSGLHGGQGTYVNVNQARLEETKHRFLKPLLRGFEEILNSSKVLGALDPDYELVFWGIDQNEQEKDVEYTKVELQGYKTLNEVRREHGLSADMEFGDVPMNPVYTAYAVQMRQIEINDKTTELEEELAELRQLQQQEQEEVTTEEQEAEELGPQATFLPTSREEEEMPQEDMQKGFTRSTETHKLYQLYNSPEIDIL